jgi:hypothetical protein
MAACRILSGRVATVLKEENVVQAYERVMAATEESAISRKRGLFYGVLIQSRRFEFEPEGENLMSGWIAEEVSKEKASEWDRQLTGFECDAEIKITTISAKTGRRSFRNELMNLVPVPTELVEPTENQ